MTDITNLVGKVLGGTYRVESLLGEGGMGVVYRAAHLRLERPFAIKMLYPEVAANTEAVERFQREARITSALGHPNIIEVIDFNHTDSGAPYIVMELLPGKDLEGVMTEGRLLLADAVTTFRQTASALQSAHGKGIIHRDLKPSNIFICQPDDEQEPYVKVLDFGISKVVGSGQALTRTRWTMGTPGYMSPEQAEGRTREVDQRSDIFSLGAILYEMLGGQPPFVGDSIPTVLFQVVHRDPQPLREIEPGIAGPLEAVVERALRKLPEERFPSMKDFAAAFDEALDSHAGGRRRDHTPEAVAPTVAVVPTLEAPVARADQQDRPDRKDRLEQARMLWRRAASAAVDLWHRVEPARDAVAAGARAASERVRQAPLWPWKAAGLGVLALLVFACAGLVALSQAPDSSRPRAVVSEPTERTASAWIPVVLPSPHGAAAASQPVQRLIHITSADRQINCNLELEGGESRAATVPCRFEIPDGVEVKLELQRRGFRPLLHTWRVERDRSMVVRPVHRKRTLVAEIGEMGGEGEIHDVAGEIQDSTP
jgi:hypothetical protein